MTPDENRIVEAAFHRIAVAIENIDQAADIDEALADIFEAINKIAPGLTENLAGLTTDEIGNVLFRFSSTARNATETEPGNIPAQIFLALTVTAEMWRRAQLDGISVMEWCRRERVRGLIDIDSEP